jgi:uncharacterized protein YlxP (DUF503 family)
MVVGVGQILLRIPESRSLKGKRSIMRQIVERVKRQFNISIAEVEAQDNWQFIHLGMCQVGLNADVVNHSLDKVLAFIEKLALAEVVDVDFELIQFSTRRTFYEKLCAFG